MKRTVFRFITVIFLSVWITGIPAQNKQEPEAFRIKHEGIELQWSLEGKRTSRLKSMA
jgi:hypothetical protein